MSEIPVTLSFHDALGRPQLADARLIDGHTWRVLANIGGHRFSRDVGSWQGVERALMWLRRHGHEVDHRPVPPLAAAAAALAILLSAAGVSAQPISPPSPAEQQFTAATREYASMHRRLEAAIGATEINADIHRIEHAVDGLAAAIRAERPAAAAGDLFTPALAPELRRRIANALLAEQLTSEAIREAERHDAVDPSLVSLRVNGAFPWAIGTAMFPCIIAALPPLPPELQYRFVGDTLVLIDVHASVVVDLLPAALAPSTER